MAEKVVKLARLRGALPDQVSVNGGKKLNIGNAYFTGNDHLGQINRKARNQTTSSGTETAGKVVGNCLAHNTKSEKVPAVDSWVWKVPNFHPSEPHLSSHESVKLCPKVGEGVLKWLGVVTLIYAVGKSWQR